MRLALLAPPGWVTEGLTARAPVGVPATLEWSHLVAAPTLPAGEPSVPGLEQLAKESTVTRDGWPVVLVDAWMVESGEMQLAAFYAFRAFVAHALLRVKDRSIYFGVRQEVLPSLLAARPHYGGALACLAQFWSDDDPAEDAR